MSFANLFKRKSVGKGATAVTGAGSEPSASAEGAGGRQHVPIAEISKAMGLPEERIALMAQMIKKNGLADEQMAFMIKTATGNGVAPSTILQMLTSLGVERSQVARVMIAAEVISEEEGARILDEERRVREQRAAAEKQAERRHKVKKALIIVFWLAVWQLLDTAMNNTLVLAGPVRTVQALAVQIVKPDFWVVCGASLTRIVAGFLLSFTVGILLALASYRVRTVRDFVEPIISLLRTIPVVSIIIMLLIWVGNQFLTVYLSFLIVLPLIYTNMLTGFENTDPQMLEMARVYRLSPWKRFMYIYRPAFMPFLTSSCKLALGMSWKSGIMAEVLATPKPSIGKEMSQARTYLNTPDLFAWTVVVMVLSWAFEKFFMWLLGLAARPLGRFLGSDDDDVSGGEEPAGETAAEGKAAGAGIASGAGAAAGPTAFAVAEGGAR